MTANITIRAKVAKTDRIHTGGPGFPVRRLASQHGHAAALPPHRFTCEAHLRAHSRERLLESWLSRATHYTQRVIMGGKASLMGADVSKVSRSSRSRPLVTVAGRPAGRGRPDPCYPAFSAYASVGATCSVHSAHVTVAGRPAPQNGRP